MFDLSTFFLLCAGHSLCDYPLQGTFLATAKNHTNPIPGVPWWVALVNHAMIHAGMVYLITGSLWFAVFELVFHFGIDYLKCDGRISFEEDQLWHIVMKMVMAS